MPRRSGRTRRTNRNNLRKSMRKGMKRRKNTMLRRNTNRKVRRNTNRKVRRNTMRRRNSRRNFRWMRGGTNIKELLLNVDSEMNLGKIEGFTEARRLVKENMDEFKELEDDRPAARGAKLFKVKMGSAGGDARYPYRRLMLNVTQTKLGNHEQWEKELKPLPFTFFDQFYLALEDDQLIIPEKLRHGYGTKYVIIPPDKQDYMSKEHQVVCIKDNFSWEYFNVLTFGIQGGWPAIHILNNLKQIGEAWGKKRGISNENLELMFHV